MYLLLKATQQDGATQPPSWKHFPEISSESVSLKIDWGLRTADCGLRTADCGLCIKRGPGIKHGIRTKSYDLKN